MLLGAPPTNRAINASVRWHPPKFSDGRRELGGKRELPCRNAESPAHAINQLQQRGAKTLSRSKRGLTQYFRNWRSGGVVSKPSHEQCHRDGEHSRSTPCAAAVLPRSRIPLQPPSEYSLRSYHIAFQYCRRIRGSFASRENRSADFSRRNRMIDDRFKTGTFLLNLETA
jgi:hypothetical protein